MRFGESANKSVPTPQAWPRGFQALHMEGFSLLWCAYGRVLDTRCSRPAAACEAPRCSWGPGRGPITARPGPPSACGKLGLAQHEEGNPVRVRERRWYVEHHRTHGERSLCAPSSPRASLSTAQLLGANRGLHQPHPLRRVVGVLDVLRRQNPALRPSQRARARVPKQTSSESPSHRREPAHVTMQSRSGGTSAPACSEHRDGHFLYLHQMRELKSAALCCSDSACSSRRSGAPALGRRRGDAATGRWLALGSTRMLLFRISKTSATPTAAPRTSDRVVAGVWGTDQLQLHPVAARRRISKLNLNRGPPWGPRISRTSLPVSLRKSPGGRRESFAGPSPRVVRVRHRHAARSRSAWKQSSHPSP